MKVMVAVVTSVRYSKTSVLSCILTFSQKLKFHNYFPTVIFFCIITFAILNNIAFINCDGGERKSTIYQSTMCSILMLWLLFFLFSTLTGKFGYTNTLTKFPPTFFQLNSIVENSIPEVGIGGREVGRIERPIEIGQKITCYIFFFNFPSRSVTIYKQI